MCPIPLFNKGPLNLNLGKIFKKMIFSPLEKKEFLKKKIFKGFTFFLFKKNFKKKNLYLGNPKKKF